MQCARQQKHPLVAHLCKSFLARERVRRKEAKRTVHPIIDGYTRKEAQVFTHSSSHSSLFSVTFQDTRNAKKPHHARNRVRRLLSLVALVVLACLFVVRFPGQAHAATTNPGSPTIQYADSHWNCTDAACTSTVSSGEPQPNFECAEFVARSLAAEGLVPGLSPSSSQAAYYSYTALNGLTYDLNLITPTSGLRTLYNYLIDTGLGTDVGNNLNQAAPGDVVVYYDGNHTAQHTTLLVLVDAANPSNSLIDAHNNAHYHYSFASEAGGFASLTIVHLHIVHPAQMADLNHDGYPDLMGEDSSGNLYAYPATGHTTIGGGMWGNRVLVGTGWNMYNWIAFADVNRDGFADVLARDDSGNLYVYPATGQTTIAVGMWGNRVLVGTGWNMFNTILVGDVNDDGYPDLLGRDNSGNLYGYVHNNTTTIVGGMWGNGVLMGTGWNMYPQIALANIGKNNSRTTGNGAELIGEDPSGNLYAYPNNDFGTFDTSSFADRILVGTGWNMYITFLTGDLTRSGYTDIVGLDGNGNLEAYPNNQVSTIGTGIWGKPVLVGTGWNMYPLVD